MKIFFLILALTLLSGCVNKSSSDVNEPRPIITYMEEGWYDTDILRQELGDAQVRRFREMMYKHLDEIESREARKIV